MNYKRFLSEHFPEGHEKIELHSDESAHARDVLRVPEGEVVELLNGKGEARLATLHWHGKKAWVAAVIETSSESTRSKRRDLGPQYPTLYLAASVLKGEAMQWLIEKSVELGVQHFQPLISERTVPNLSTKGPEGFQYRWQKMADQALKQCGRLYSMKIHLPQTLTEWNPPKQSTYVLVEPSENQKLPLFRRQLRLDHPKELAIVIGPEGGWSDSDLEILKNHPSNHKFTFCGLGDIVLRAETACFTAIVQSQEYFEDQSLTKNV